MCLHCLATLPPNTITPCHSYNLRWQAARYSVRRLQRVCVFYARTMRPYDPLGACVFTTPWSSGRRALQPPQRNFSQTKLTRKVNTVATYALHPHRNTTSTLESQNRHHNACPACTTWKETHPSCTPNQVLTTKYRPHHP